MRDQVSHQFKATVRFIILDVLIFTSAVWMAQSVTFYGLHGPGSNSGESEIIIARPDRPLGPPRAQ